MNRTKILGTGSFLPKKIVTNHDLAKILDTSDEWIVSRTGIRERHVVSEGETCSDLAYHASLQALKAAGKTAQDLDMIIVATLTPEQRVPATSCMLQEKLKATQACVYDINVSCSGFVYALASRHQKKKWPLHSQEPNIHPDYALPPNLVAIPFHSSTHEKRLSRQSK